MNETEQSLDERSIWQSFLESVEEKHHINDDIVGIFLCVILAVSVIGNSLTSAVIYLDRSMHTVTNYYLFNLAVSDLIVTLSIPVELYYRYQNWNVYNTMTSSMCKVQYFIVGLLWNNSVLTVTALAVERFLVIWYPLLVSSKPAWNRIMKIIIVLWIIAAIEILLELQTADLMVTNNSSTCFIIPTTSARTINAVLAVLTFIIPLVIIVTVYLMVIVKVNRNRSLIRNKAFNYPHSNRNKVNKLIVAITLSFFICWIPFFVMRVLIFALDIKQLMNLKNIIVTTTLRNLIEMDYILLSLQIAGEVFWRVLYDMTTVNGWISTAINPILLSLMSTKFREALKRMWFTRILKKWSMRMKCHDRNKEGTYLQKLNH